MLNPALPLGQWEVPEHVFVDSESVRWLPFDPLSPRRQFTTSDADLLRAFVDLRDAKPNKAETFISRWGVLAVCEHGLPHSHGLAAGGIFPLDHRHHACALTTTDEGWYTEDLESWRQLSRQAASMLNLGAAVRRSQRGSAIDWAELSVYMHFFDEDAKKRWQPSRLDRPRTLHQARTQLAFIIRQWLSWGCISVDFQWHQGTRPTPIGPFGAVALQIAHRVSLEPGQSNCSACGRYFSPKRRPRADQRSYCDACRASGAPGRDAQRARRERLRHEHE